LAADTHFRRGCVTIGLSAGFPAALFLAVGLALFFPEDGLLETAISAGSLPWSDKSAPMLTKNAEYQKDMPLVNWFFDSFNGFIKSCELPILSRFTFLNSGKRLPDESHRVSRRAQVFPTHRKSDLMTAHQILEAIGPELRSQIFTYFQTHERPAYRAVIDSLTGARKLRPQFILEKSRAQQTEWMLAQLGMKSNGPIIEQILQIWLLKSQGAMLTTFLDAAGIEHDGKGQVDELPDDIAEDKAEAGVKALLAAFPAKQVALYLHMFQIQRPEGWAGLTKVMEAHPESKL
jgi:hypothetical protein